MLSANLPFNSNEIRDIQANFEKYLMKD